MPWANNCNSINNRLEKQIIPCNAERNIIPKERLAQELVNLFFLIFLSIEVINGCEPDMVLGTKNDDATTELVVDIDAEVEPVPLPCSPEPNTLFASCFFIFALASLLCSNSSNDLMALRMVFGFVFV